jgi:hypothetical protein
MRRAEPGSTASHTQLHKTLELRLRQSLVSLHFLFDLLDALLAQTATSAEKHIDGIEGELTFFVGVAVVANYVVEFDQFACGCFRSHRANQQYSRADMG